MTQPISAKERNHEKKLEITDKKLYLQYAIPCTSVLVARGAIAKEFVQRLMDFVLKGKETDFDISEIFTVSYKACSKIARDRRKGEIGPDEIRDYFWKLHDDVIDRRFEEKRDFDKDACRIWAGKVLRLLEGNKAEVLTQRGNLVFRSDFEPKLQSGDNVLVHYDFITEKVSKKVAGMIWEARNRRFGSEIQLP